MVKLILSFMVLFLALPLIATAADAPRYPVKPIEVVVPYSPGGPVDLTVRVVADMAPRFLGQPIAVVNKPGAAGSVAAADVISSNADGYKLMASSPTFFTVTTKTQKIPFNPFDLVPIANFSEDKIGIVVRGDSPWKTLNDMIEYGKKNPGKIKWAHTGKGNALHMMGLTVFRKAGVETIDVPYKGVPETANALLGGHVEAVSGPYATFQEFIRGGKARYLMVYSDRRYTDLPNVPCAGELGFQQATSLAVYWGIYTHKDTPKEIQAILLDAFKKASDMPEFKPRIERLGMAARFGGPDFVREAIKKAEGVAPPILKELGLYK